MKKVLNTKMMAGARKMNAPRPIGELLAEFFRSDSPLAVGYRRWLADRKEGKEVWYGRVD